MEAIRLTHSIHTGVLVGIILIFTFIFVLPPIEVCLDVVRLQCVCVGGGGGGDYKQSIQA